MKHGYKAFFNGKEAEVFADSQYGAQLKAIEFFKPRKKQEHMVHVHLCELQGEPVTHTPDF